jgi:hypothetical protein
MKAYTLTMKWNHRKFGPQHSTWRIEATNISVAIARGTREWLKAQETRTRRDAAKGLTVVALLLGAAVETKDVTVELSAPLEQVVRRSR